MKIITKKAPIGEFEQMARKMFGDFVKVVVDVENGIMAVDGELHADEEALLIENGSEQKNLWGINIYPEVEREDWIEFDSMINVRPSLKNLTRGIDDPNIRKEIIKIVNSLIEK